MKIEEKRMAYGEMNLHDAGLQLLISILEFMATLVRMLHERIVSDAEVPTASVGRRASNIPEVSSEVAEVRLEEGQGVSDLYTSEALRERMRILATQKPQRYYAVARGRAPGIYTSWTETEPHVNRFSGSKFESFGTREAAEAWLLREINESV